MENYYFFIYNTRSQAVNTTLFLKNGDNAMGNTISMASGLARINP